MRRFLAGVAVGALAYPFGLFVGALIHRHHNGPSHAFGA